MCRNCFPSIVSTFRGCNVTVFLLGLPGNLDEDEEARTKKSELFHPGLCSCGCDSTYIRATGSDLVYKKKRASFFFLHPEMGTTAPTVRANASASDLG